MDETFDLGSRRSADGPDLLQREVAFENHPRKPRLAQKPRPFGRAVRNLRRGVQFHRKVHPPQSHVLHDQRVDARGDQRPGLPFGGLQFVVPHERVERGMGPHPEAVGVLHDPGDLPVGVPCGLPRAEPRAADIDRIGAVIHGRRGRGVIFGRS